MLAAFHNLRRGLVGGGEGKTGVALGGEGLAVTACNGYAGLLGEAGSRHVFGLSVGVFWVEVVIPCRKLKYTLWGIQCSARGEYKAKKGC